MRREKVKENSIEEDIKIANNFMTYFNKNIQNGYKADLTVLGEEIEAIEHIISDYKRVLKENEELEEINNELEAEKNEAIRRYNFETIPKQKVKDKIEELKNISNTEELEDIMNRKNYTISELVQYVLQELLEGRKI